MNVTIVSSKLNAPKAITSSATTWGELKSDLKKNGIEYGNMAAVLKDTRQNMELDDAKLPEGDFTMFLLAKKIKSGMPVKKAVKKVVKKTPVKKAVVKKAIAKKPAAKKAPVKKAAPVKEDNSAELMQEAKELQRHFS